MCYDVSTLKNLAFIEILFVTKKKLLPLPRLIRYVVYDSDS